MENDNLIPMQRLDVYQAALQLARRVHETVAAIDLALAIGAVSREDAEAIQALALRLKCMLRALICRAGG